MSGPYWSGPAGAGGHPRARRPAGPRWLAAAIAVLFALAPVAAIRAETETPAPARAAPPERVWAAEALDKLTGRIALYPDALIAQILPAATFPIQVVEAQRWLDAKKSVAEGEKQEWDPSVKALLRYPTVLKMMSDDLRWTDELGLAFAAQPEDVLKSVQRLRQQAHALGNLKPSSRQRVVVDPDNVILIAPPAAEPDVVYIPIYDPMMVFYEPPPPSGLWITFDAGFPLGVWIGTGIYWRDWHVVYGGWGYDWGWGDIYGGCCRGAVYNHIPTVHNRRLHVDHNHYWRRHPAGDHARTPFARRPLARPTPADIARGRLTPHTTIIRPDMRKSPRPSSFGDIQRRTVTERNVLRGRESLSRAPQFRRFEAQKATPPARFTPSAPKSRSPDPGFAPRGYAPSPSFTPRSQPETHKFFTRGNESRSLIRPPDAAKSFREAPRPGPGSKPSGRKR